MSATVERSAADQQIASATTLPATWYADEAHHRNELAAVFARGWSCVGVVDDVPPGGWMATTAGAVPVVVTRDRDGALHAFLNACRHRGAPVAEGCGESRHLTCPYHAWSYRLDGSLATSSGMAGAIGFDPEDFGLLEVGVATWSRFLFVCPLEQPPVFDLGPLAAAIDPYPDDLQLVWRKSVERGFNWKLLLENYSENFHTPFVHPQLTWQRWEYPIIGQGSIALAWDRPMFPSNAVEHALAGSSPMEPGWADVAVDQIDDIFLAGTYFTVFPNLLVSAFPRYTTAFWLTPTAVDRTVVSYARFWSDEVDAARREQDLEASEDVAAQDLDICEAMQLTFSGGVDQRGRLSPEHETGVFHVHQLVRDALATRHAAIDPSVTSAVARPAVRGVGSDT